MLFVEGTLKRFGKAAKVGDIVLESDELRKIISLVIVKSYKMYKM